MLCPPKEVSDAYEKSKLYDVSEQAFGQLQSPKSESGNISWHIMRFMFKNIHCDEHKNEQQFHA